VTADQPGHDMEPVPSEPGHVPRCGANCRSKEGPCRNKAGWGTDHVGVGRCRKHLGNTENHRVSAARQATTAEATEMLKRLGQPAPLGDPVEELLQLGAEIRAWLEVLRELVARAKDIATYDVAHREYERASIKLYGEQLDRAHRVLSDLAKLGLDQRRVRVSEIQTATLVAAVTAMVRHEDLALDAGRQARALEIVALEVAARN
jgi:hypothetical protein